ncbi:MAG: hypothetical protein LBJ43_01610 [Propionibacteriaceae bacterium]|nr:hypothetical protein [Propionibacteriaceae bacterium]
MQSVVEKSSPIQNPDDYAFIAYYDATRLLKLVAGAQSAVRGRVISLVISLLFAGFIWYSNGHKVDFQLATTLMLLAIAAAIVGQLVALFMAKSAPPGSSKTSWVLAITHMVTVVLLLPPTLLIRVTSHFYSDETFADLTWVPTVLLIVLIAIAALVVAGAVLLMLWRINDVRSYGFLARKIATTAVMATGVFCLLVGIVATMLGQSVLPGRAIPESVHLEAYDPVTLDWSMWLIASMLGLVVARMGHGTANMAHLVNLLTDMPVGPALRIDAAGVALADPRTPGPDRASWNEINISARAHTQTPGAELVVRWSDGRSWSVPFLYLNVLPGTIDSAIRSATLGARVLSLHKLDRIV